MKNTKNKAKNNSSTLLDVECMDTLKKKSLLLDELDVATGALLVALNVYENALVEISKIKEKIRALTDNLEQKKIKNDSANKIKKVTNK